MFDVSIPTLSLSSHRLHVGDHVVIARDVLAEVVRETAGLPPTWMCVPAGMRGRLIGWRDPRAIVDLSDGELRLVVVMGEGNVARIRGHAPTLPSTATNHPRTTARPRRSYRSRHR